MASPYPFQFNPEDPQNGGSPSDPGNPAFMPPSGMPGPFAGFPGPPPSPDGNPGLYFPDSEPQYDPDMDPVAQRLQKAEPLDLSLDLGEEREMMLAHLLCSEIDRYKAAVARRVANLDVWRKAVECLPPGTANRWQNSSDIPSPLSKLATMSHHGRLNQQILNASPPFTAVARTPDARDKTTIIEECMASVLDQADWPQVADDLHRELATAGNVFLRTTYEREYARLPKRLVEHDEDTRDSLLSAGVEPHEAVWHSVKRVKFGHEDELIYDGVRWKVIPFEDGVIWPVTCRDPEKAMGIGERLRLNGAELLDGVRQGFYRETAVDELLNHPSDAEPMERLYRKDEQGLMPDSMGGSYVSPEERLYKEYEIYELNFRYDADDDEQLEWIVVHLHKDTRQIIGLRWMEYEHGRPYYQMGRYIQRTGELFGMSIPELIASYQDGDTNVINQIVDHNDLALNIGGNFAVTGLAGYNPDENILQLGRPLKFENLAETEFRPLPPIPLPTEAYKLNDIFKNWTDLLTATSNPTLGKETDTNKTLGEVQMVFNSANQIFEDFAARVARSLHAKAWDAARWLTAQYGLQNDAGEITYRRTAAPDVIEFASIKPSDLTAAVDLVPTGVVQLSDQASRIQQATLIQAQLMQLLGSVQAWLPFSSVVMISFGQYMKALSYPLKDKILAAIEAVIQPMQMQMLQQQQQAQAMMMAQGGGQGPGMPGGAVPPGAGAPAPPPGDIGGPPPPIEGPPPLPPGSAPTNALPMATGAL